MPQSLSKIWVHFVFSTKNRVGYLLDKSIRDEMHSFLANIFRTYEPSSVTVGGVADHVHILCTLSRNHTVAEIIKETKRKSSIWVKTKGSNFSNFHWQSGYGAFSVSESNLDQVRTYILNQEGHHKKMTFQEEYRQFLQKYNVEYDEQYVWD